MIEEKKSVRRVILTLLLVVSALGTRRVYAEEQINVGSGHFLFKDAVGNKDKPITVWYHRPKRFSVSSPILFVMHGVKRNGKHYRDAWIRYADRHKFLLIVPEFSKKHYPGSRQYNRGNMFDKKGKLVEKSKWTYSAIEHLFDHVVKLTGSKRKSYLIYGHSAGGQFVHRLATFLPEARFQTAVATNAGWYCIPSFDVEFPYGLKDSGFKQGGLKKSLSKNMVVMVGAKDTDENHQYLNKSPQAMKQGRHRLDRARNYYEVAKREAKRLRAPLKWRLVIVPKVAHSNSGMAKAAVKVLFQR